MAVRWDIFCCVVDNYGDIGVTWRLARQLAAEHGHRVRRSPHQSLTAKPRAATRPQRATARSTPSTGVIPARIAAIP